MLLYQVFAVYKIFQVDTMCGIAKFQPKHMKGTICVFKVPSIENVEETRY